MALFYDKEKNGKRHSLVNFYYVPQLAFTNSSKLGRP